MLTPRAIELIINGEIGAIDRYIPHPLWPGGRSGITIGVGYDLGQHHRNDLADDWDAELDSKKIFRLARCCLIHGGNAQHLLPGVRDIVIPWDSACRVFENISLPEYERLTQHAFPGCERAPAGVYGALVSLVYNRGGAIDGPGREEMASIRLAIEAGDYPAIPIAIRSMARLWFNTSIEDGMTARREAEAALAESDLA